MTWTPQNIKNTAGPGPANSNPDEGMGFLQRQQLERDRALMVKRASAQMSEQTASVAPSNTPDLAQEAPYAAAAIARDRALNESRARSLDIDPSLPVAAQDALRRNAEHEDRRAADAAAAAVAAPVPAGEHFLVTQTRERDRLHAERCRASAHTPTPKVAPHANVAEILPQNDIPFTPSNNGGPDATLQPVQQQAIAANAAHKRYASRGGRR